ncbi:hypothetical protein E0H26_11600 [Micromonospora zingiberis]|uniref:Uncharacterized protein n=1 Tax=Micromonospora zingiberis TaxID=2053011 RepID=A0A4R0GJX8_9ACTN|nr:hypothetical protein [Micromonospora zingiberis]TCB97556.1 hypothetical protein E0H26_11600 [Micromonospora zingiberis]
MSENNRPSYVALVAALRSEFSPRALEALKIQLAEYLHHRSSISTLTQAVIDAGSVTYNPGDDVHPAVRGWFDSSLTAQECTHGGDCLVHPDARQVHNFDAEPDRRPLP